MQNHSQSKISSGDAKTPNGDARQVFRQFAWNLAGSLKSPKTKISRQKPRVRKGKNK